MRGLVYLAIAILVCAFFGLDKLVRKFQGRKSKEDEEFDAQIERERIQRIRARMMNVISDPALSYDEKRKEIMRSALDADAKQTLLKHLESKGQ